MVSNTENNNVVVVPARKPVSSLPEGKYRLVGWDIDTTGRRLIDEICQIAVFSPTSNFAQYVMPYADLKPIAQRRHNIRVVTLHRYRMLKNLKTNKFIKTKSEISALIDFLTWLESIKTATDDGIILVSHEIRKMAPAMLLEALHRYSLQDRFSAVVKGFANSYELAENKCGQTMKSYSLKVLSKVLLDKEHPDLDSAPYRAELCYQIVQHLGQGERQDLDTEGSGDNGVTATEIQAMKLILDYTNSVQAEEEDLAELKIVLERQNTFKPVFKVLLATNQNNRRHASRLRRLLVENNFNFDQMKTAWDNGGKPSIEELLKKIPVINEKDYADLLEIFDCFFDPDKKPVQPKPRIHKTSHRAAKENRENPPKIIKKEEKTEINTKLVVEKEIEEKPTTSVK